MTTPDPLTAIEERARKATPGPWIVDQGSDSGDMSKLSIRELDEARFAGGFWLAEMVGDLAIGTREDNADFIAAARADVPRLVEALRRAMEYVSHARRAELDADITAILSRP